MEREEFLKSLGIGLALVCTGSCFQACKKGGDGDAATPDPGTGSTASVDISTMAAVGSQTTANGVLFFRIASGNQSSAFVATEALCPHQGGTLSWIQSGDKIQCGLHNATYTKGGGVTSQPVGGGSTRALKIYALALTGTTLTANKASNVAIVPPPVIVGNTVSVDLASLSAIGSQTSSNGVLFFRTAAGDQASSFVATEAACPHQGGTLSWIQSGNKIQCGLHSATYSNTGSVLSDPVGGGSTRALQLYALAVSGNTLTATKS